MRRIIYKKLESLKKRRKIIQINESSKEKDYSTRVRKNFIYIVKKEDKVDPDLKAPNIYITKQLNSKTREEKFHFRVKGAFYMVQDDTLFRVNFRHSLHIKIDWKSDKHFSPNKSVTLT